jgi:hypothetical protein
MITIDSLQLWYLAEDRIFIPTPSSLTFNME